MNKSISDQIFSSSNSKHYLVIFIFWPFLAFLLALANYSQKEARKVVYIFLIYYGLTFVNTNEYVDAYRYAMILKTNASLTFSEIFKSLSGVYTTSSTIDIVEPIVSFIVSRFTINDDIYFAIWAALFGFFYLKSINLLYERNYEKHNWNATIIMIFFIIIMPITLINGVRMWTAGWIFFYGAYHVVLFRNPKFFIITLASSFVHWSFFSANAILLIYFFAGNRNFIYLPLAIASFIIPQYISPVFQMISMRLGGAFQTRYENYSSEGNIIATQEMAEGSSWFLRIGNDLVFYFLLFALVVIQLRSKSLMNEKSEKNLFSFLLLFMAFVNFGNIIPSFGSRFQVLFFLFSTLYVFLYSLKLSENRINILTMIGLFPMILYAFITFRIGAESINVWIFTPGLGIPLLDPNFSISDLLFH